MKSVFMIGSLCAILLTPIQSFALERPALDKKLPININVPVSVDESVNENTNTGSNDITTNSPTDKPILKLPVKQTINQPVNVTLPDQKKEKKIPQDIQINEAIPDVKEATHTTPILPKFKRTVGEQLPTTIERYQDFLEERSVKTEQTTILSGKTKERLQQAIGAETHWLQNKTQELTAADTIEDRQVIQKEIQSYIEDRRNERRELIEKNIAAPKTESLEKAQEISTKFDTIINQFARVGIDTSQLEETLVEYNTTVQETKDILAALETERSIEDIQALREHIATLRELSSALRNQVQTILVQEQS